MPGGLGMDAVSLAFLSGGTSDTTVATDPTISATGGGGADAPAGAVREPTHSLPENFEPKGPSPNSGTEFMNHPPVSDIPEADLAHSMGISRADLKKNEGIAVLRRALEGRRRCADRLYRRRHCCA
jgi:hypothetical protein